MNFEILSFQLIYTLWWFLKRDREKGNEKKTFCDKGQNSCYDVDFLRVHSCHKLIYYCSYKICYKKQW